MRTSAAQYDNAPLIDNADHAYTRVLDELSERWLRWVSVLGLDKLVEPGAPNLPMEEEVELASEGLKMIVYSASFQTLPTRRT